MSTPITNHQGKGKGLLYGLSRRLSKGFAIAGEMITGPTPTKSLRYAIESGDEDKAMEIYMIQNPQGKALIDDLHPSQPFPTKKINKFETPLHLASKMGMKLLLITFLQHGGNPNAGNSNDETCLHCLCQNAKNEDERYEMLEIIIKWKNKDDGYDEIVSITHADIEGNSALHYAASNGLMKCVEKLIFMNSIISLVNKSQMTCCELADENGHKELASMLELALVFQPNDLELEFSEGVQNFNNRSGILYLDSQSFVLNDIADLMGKTIDDTFNYLLNHTAGPLSSSSRYSITKERTEVLLNAYACNAEKLKLEFSQNPDLVFTAAKLLPYLPTHQDERVGDENILLFLEAFADEMVNVNTDSRTGTGTGTGTGGTHTVSTVIQQATAASTGESKQGIHRGEWISESMLSSPPQTTTSSSIPALPVSNDRKSISHNLLLDFHDIYSSSSSLSHSKSKPSADSDSFFLSFDDVLESKPMTTTKSSSTTQTPGISKSTTTITTSSSVNAATKHIDTTSTVLGCLDGEPCPICSENMVPMPTLSMLEQMRGVACNNKKKGRLLSEQTQIRCPAGHGYCLSCWSSHLQVQVMENGAYCLGCPGYKCAEILNSRWSKVVLAEEAFVTRLQEQRLRHFIDCNSSHMKWCTAADCGCIICIDSSSNDELSQMASMQLNPSSSSSNKSNGTQGHNSNNQGQSNTDLLQLPKSVLCHNNHDMCLACSSESHTPCSCSDWITWQQRVEEEIEAVSKFNSAGKLNSENDMANAMWLAANTKRCPRCTSPIEKDEGCNHMTCRKCRHEFCWICMQEWSLHSNTTGGFFQCNRFVAGASSDDTVPFGEDQGNAQIDSLRRKQRGAKMARFIQYYTKFKAYSDSVTLEKKMSHETLSRIQRSLEETAGAGGEYSSMMVMKWLQGERVLHPFISSNPGNENLNAKNSSQEKCRQSQDEQVLLTDIVENGNGNFHGATQDNNSIKLSSLSSKTLAYHSCLDFLHSGFVELIKCREFLKGCVAYSFSKFNDDDDFTVIMGSSMLGRYAKYRAMEKNQEHQRLFERLQSELECYTEMLSDVVARRRLRASHTQIQSINRLSRNKRLELEELVYLHRLSEAIDEQDNKSASAFRPSSNNRNPSRPRLRPVRVSGSSTGTGRSRLSNSLNAIQDGDNTDPSQAQSRSNSHTGSGGEDTSGFDDTDINISRIIAEMELQMQRSRGNIAGTTGAFSLSDNGNGTGNNIFGEEMDEETLNLIRALELSASSSDAENNNSSFPHTSQPVSHGTIRGSADYEGGEHEETANDANLDDIALTGNNAGTTGAGAGISAANHSRGWRQLSRRAQEEAALNRAILMSLQDSPSEQPVTSSSLSPTSTTTVPSLTTTIGTPANPPLSSSVPATNPRHIETLVGMGFSPEQANDALVNSNNDLDSAINLLLS